MGPSRLGLMEVIVIFSALLMGANAQGIALWTQTGKAGHGCAGTPYMVDTYYGGECIQLPNGATCWNNIYVAPEYAHLHTGSNCGGKSYLVNLNEDVGPGASKGVTFHSLRLTSTPTSSTKRDDQNGTELAERSYFFGGNPNGYYWYQNSGWIKTTNAALSGGSVAVSYMSQVIPTIWTQLDLVGRKYTNINSFYKTVKVGSQTVYVSVSMDNGRTISVANIKFITEQLMRWGAAAKTDTVSTEILGSAAAVIGTIIISQYTG